MAFDLDAYRAAHRPWTFTIGGRSFGARHVSALDCARFDRMILDAGTDQKKGARAVWWILRRAFPWRLSYSIRGDPVKIIFGLEVGARYEVMKDFFVCLRGLSPTPPQSTTNGTRSPAPTPHQRA